MKLINRWTMAAEAADLLRIQGDGFGDWGKGMGPGWREKAQAALDALGPAPSPEQVEAIWPGHPASEFLCHECKKYAAEVVEVGEEPDYESSTAQICATCLMAAMKLIEP